MPSPRTLRLYWDTIRHLRPVQLHGRLRHIASRPKPDTRAAPALRAIDASRWASPARRRQSLLGAETFRFLNQTRSLPEMGWDDAGTDKLWRYNLHYFDDLNAEGAEQRVGWHRELLARWIAENPPGQGSGWEPYPASLRIVNWIKWALAGSALDGRMLDSLAVQARWLMQRLEYHLLGNHLFANAKALIFAGLFFDGPEAEAWLQRGMTILAREVPEQILADGGHFELSTMYHALALEDMLDLVNLTAACREALPDRWRGVVAGWPERVRAMRAWLAAMCHPDGEISFFNDAAFGVAPTPAELEAYALRLGLGSRERGSGPVTWLKDSGYVRLESGPAVALLDVARVGPDYLPGHAHADTLSFELSLGGRRVLVNSGTSVYGTGAERLRQRGTAAHNTVVVDGRDSSEVWAGFRVARRARPQALSAVQEPGIKVECTHDGYTRLPGAPLHRRSWNIDAGRLVVTDIVAGGSHAAEARFHFHPEAEVQPDDPSATGCARLPGGARLRWRSDGGQVRIEPCTYHPEFGLSLPATCLVVPLRDGRASVEFRWNGD